MKSFQITQLLKTIFFLLLFSFPFFCIGLFAQTTTAAEEEMKKETTQLIKLSDEELKEYTGKYQALDGPVVTFTLEEGALFGQPADDTKEELIPIAEDTFRLKNIDAKVYFERTEEKVSKLRLEMGNGEVHMAFKL